MWHGFSFIFVKRVYLTGAVCRMWLTLDNNLCFLPTSDNIYCC